MKQPYYKINGISYNNPALVNLFNKKFPVGSTVSLRKYSVESDPYKEYKVIGQAFMLNDVSAVAFFEGISGCFSIEPGFVDYSCQCKNFKPLLPGYEQFGFSLYAPIPFNMIKDWDFEQLEKLRGTILQAMKEALGFGAGNAGDLVGHYGLIIPILRAWGEHNNTYIIWKSDHFIIHKNIIQYDGKVVFDDEGEIDPFALPGDWLRQLEILSKVAADDWQKQKADAHELRRQDLAKEICEIFDDENEPQYEDQEKFPTYP